MKDDEHGKNHHLSRIVAGKHALRLSNRFEVGHLRSELDDGLIAITDLIFESAALTSALFGALM